LRKISIFVLILLAVAQLNLFDVGAQEQATIEVRSDKISLAPGETLAIKLYGKERVVTLYSFPSHAKVELVEQHLQEWFYGIVTVRLNFSVEKTYKGELIFRSWGPFNLTLAKMSSASEDVIKTYVCPANVTLRLLLQLGLEESWKSASINAQVQLFDVDSWGLIPYAVFTPLFGAVLMLDLRDMKRRKSGKWGLLDSIALAVRYFLYSSVVSLAVVALWTLGSLIYALLMTGAASFKLGGLLASLIVSSAMGLTYAVARWRGWYELIDEED
jgi:hypothetical protein